MSFALLLVFGLAALPSAAPLPPLPDGWFTRDVGLVGTRGYVLGRGAAFIVRGSGHGPGDASDSFQFVYRELTGNGEVVTRLTDIQASSDAAAGLMLRESLTADATFAAIRLHAGGAVTFTRRASAQDASTSSTETSDAGHATATAATTAVRSSGITARTPSRRAARTPSPTAQPRGTAVARSTALPSRSRREVVATPAGTATPPVYLRLWRNGDTVSAHTSIDGQTWALVATETVSMARTIYAGLVVDGGGRGPLTTASFSAVHVGPTGSAPSLPPSETISRQVIVATAAPPVTSPPVSSGISTPQPPPPPPAAPAPAPAPVPAPALPEPAPAPAPAPEPPPAPAPEPEPAPAPEPPPAPQPAPEPEPPPAPAPAPDPPRGGDDGGSTVRLLQWNIHHGIGTDGVLDLDRIARWVARSGANLVSLNEVDTADMAAAIHAHLESQTGAQWHSSFSGWGNQILTRLSVGGSSICAFNPGAGRLAVHVNAYANGRAINVWSAHLAVDSAGERMSEVYALQACANDWSEARILAGDFNMQASSAEYAAAASGYRDAWAAARDAGTTINYSGNCDGCTRNSRIDYVFTSRGAGFLTLLSAQMIDTRDGNGAMPSDHKPLLVTYGVN